MPWIDPASQIPIHIGAPIHRGVYVAYVAIPNSPSGAWQMNKYLWDGSHWCNVQSGEPIIETVFAWCGPLPPPEIVRLRRATAVSNARNI